VINSKAANNLYKKYGAKKEHDKSYKHDVKLENTNDQYSKDDLELLRYFAYSSQNSNGTIWFGHYPSASIHESDRFRDIMTYV